MIGYYYDYVLFLFGHEPELDLKNKKLVRAKWHSREPLVSGKVPNRNGDHRQMDMSSG